VNRGEVVDSQNIFSVGKGLHFCMWSDIRWIFSQLDVQICKLDFIDVQLIVHIY